ncbi:HD domain-containing protein [Candidatus Woesearchaeota archaeon]|nr:HD domain-containing protein [Candidatus Woesearchaeota archaeon]
MNEKDALEILDRNIEDKRILKIILNHSSTVKLIAVSIAQKINRKKDYSKKIDINTIKVAAMLHDIGREKCPPKTDLSIKHNLIGEEIIKSEIKRLTNELKTANEIKAEKLIKDIEILKVAKKTARNHIGVGLSKKDILKNKLDLPPKNYIPTSIEEKIIAYSDKLVDDARIRDINYVMDRFGNWLGEDYKKKILKLHRYLHKLMGDSAEIKIEKKSSKILNVLFF